MTKKVNVSDEFFGADVGKEILPSHGAEKTGHRNQELIKGEVGKEVIPAYVLDKNN